jgi:hypothetical protein
VLRRVLERARRVLRLSRAEVAICIDATVEAFERIPPFVPELFAVAYATPRCTAAVYNFRTTGRTNSPHLRWGPQTHTATRSLGSTNFGGPVTRERLWTHSPAR